MPADHKSILFVGNHLSESGQNKSVGEELAAGLQNRNWQVLLVSRKVSRPLRLVDMLWTIFTQRNVYQVAEVDVFSGPAFTWAYLSCWLLKSLKKPFILTLHGGNLPAFCKKHYRRVSKALSWANLVISPSGYLQSEMKHFRPDIVLIPNGIDIARYPFRERGVAQPNMVWLRAFHQIYNPSLAPEVIAKLRPHFEDVHLLMVGPDKGDGSLQSMLNTARQLGFEDSIEVIQGVAKEQVSEMLNRGDLFLNTTNYDNTPVSVIEAMACGLCIVSTNVGGIPYLLEDGVDALLVPPNDPEAMAAAVTRILTEPGLAEKLSRNARKKAEQFDWSIILPKWEQLITSLLEKSSS